VTADDSPTDGARAAAAPAPRDSYGRLLAYLLVRSREAAGAEDALGDALVAALETWPRPGVPDRPEAWLLTVARRRLVDATRHARVRSESAGALELMLEGAEADAATPDFPDERLKLLFVCAHPAIDPAMRTPLMLQSVLGLDAARIASAFLVAPAAMGQRLVREKARIRGASIDWIVPDARELPGRLAAVLEAIYAAYGSGWDDVAGADPRRRGLAEEALALGRLVARLLPEEPEALGLLALMLHCEARRGARRDDAGRYVPLDQQDVGRWSEALIEEVEAALAAAARAGQPGRFQLEAAIQSAHVHRAVTGRTDWEAIALLYEGLLRSAPTIGARVGQAAAIAEARGTPASWAALAAIPAAEVSAYQPYWAPRAHLLRKLRRADEARDAYERAIGLSEDPAVREFLVAEAGR
jgi:RNA polymerase sigma-70 factor (ECF subfamily)